MCIILNQTNIQLIGLILNFIGAFILTLPYILRSEEDIEKESKSTFGINITKSKSMKREKRFTKIGLIFLIVGFLVQILAILV